MSKTKILLIALFLMVIIVAGYLLNKVDRPEAESGAITSFAECVEAGFPVMESYPEQCRTDEGLSFTRQLTAEELVEIISPIEIIGTFTCLPHWDMSGPVTQECAFGLKTEAGDYYVLKDLNNSIDFQVESASEIKVFGIHIPGSDQIYQSVGTIEIESIEILD